MKIAISRASLPLAFVPLSLLVAGGEAAFAVQSAGAAPQQPTPALDRDQLEARIGELEERLKKLEEPAAAVPADPHALRQEATHAAPPGYWAVPGSDFAFKIGGYVKLDVIHDFDTIGNPYKFSTQSIEVPGESASETTIHARESRINLDLRGPLGSHDLRVFVEGDFFGDGNTFELRHAYGQWGGLLAGQTWTTYMDISSRPHTLDFEGPDGEIFVRQPMVRWTQHTGGKNSFSIAIEDSSPDFTLLDGSFTGEDSTPLPDLAANYRLEGDGRHAQLSGVLRYLDLEGDAGSPDEDDLGWGVALSGKTQLGDPGRRLMGQVSYGEGSAHYNQATRGAGSDAVLEPDGSFTTLPVTTAVAGYEHDWSKQWSSTVAWSFASVDGLDVQATDALDRSQSASANIVWQPNAHFLTGFEFLYGERENRDGEKGDAHRIQFSFKFLF